MKVTMLPILSSATQPVNPVLNRDADNLARFSAPPDRCHNYDEDKYDNNYDDNDSDNYADKNDEDWSPR